jgi:NAD(P)-dependent dehydrogenase (short-subunit alcohol dehydrogenase family)
MRLDAPTVSHVAMSRLEGRTALVTGAGSGLGEAIALAYAREGARVVVADLREEGGNRVVGQIGEQGGEALFAHADVRKEDDVRQAVHTALDAWGRLDVLVNNAGIASARDELLKLDQELWDEIIDVNMRSVFFGMKHAVPPMIEQGGGAIVSMASIGALTGSPGGLAYGASKAGIVKMTVVVAARYAKHGIRANCILPGMMLTPLAERAFAQLTRDQIAEQYKTYQPLPRSGRAEDIADAAVWLASDESSFVTGQPIVVDGGRVMAGWGGTHDRYGKDGDDW